MDGMMTVFAGADDCDSTLSADYPFAFEAVIDEICRLPWQSLDDAEVLQVAKAYYYFSIQFRENLEAACRLLPHDAKLQQLYAGECDTDNLSPWPGVTAPGEKLNHDEFMRRALELQPVDQEDYLTLVGQTYLDRVRAFDDATRAATIASYEDGGLSRVFTAMLRARHWHGEGSRAFRFFLEEHIRFDSDDDGGHGALSRHLRVDDDILPLWIAFRELLVAAVPKFWQPTLGTRARDRVQLVAVPAQ